MIDGIIIVQVLMHRENQQPQVGDNNPKLGEEIIQPADVGDIARKPCLSLAEGAGAASLAAAMAGKAGSGKVACVISGGNIDAKKLAQILLGELP